ncbi:tyrosine-type recombinase/integrase [Peribacillus frigoritolerans]|uniref:tyrosine-type recombinase/integrase n=1 Tax=Peribacillus frigoritolerans TaxID=450367 RepID=UPI0022813FE6|nr:site-specific integrase [Peribacillus frigoritolerans]MCY9005718.1 site-specific integrase [Peribacillus frigoritolerans]
MFEVKILEETINYQIRKVNINGHYFSIKKKIHFILNELPGILQDLRNYLLQNDSAGISTILWEYKSQQVNATLYRCMDVLLPTEFEQYCLHLCGYFTDEIKKPQISQSNIFKFMLTNNIDLAFNNKNSEGQWHSEDTGIPRRAIDKFQNNKFEEFIISCEKHEIEAIREIFPHLGEIPLLNRIYANEAYTNVFENFIRRVGENLIEEEKALSKSELVRYILTGTSIPEQKKDQRFSTLRELKIIQEVVTYVYQTIAKKPNSYNVKDDVWKVREKNEQGFISLIFDFSPLSEEDKPYVKAYIHELLMKTDASIGGVWVRLNSIKIIYKRFKELRYKDVKSILQMNYYHILHLLDYLQQLRDEKGKQCYKLTTISEQYCYVKLFIDWIIENYDWQYDNVFSLVPFHNIKAYSDPTKYIPEKVIQQLEHVLHELPEIYQNAWEIMMNSGMRFSDVQGLQTDCIPYDESEEMYVLKFINQKMKKQRIRSGQSKYHVIPASDLLIEAVERQKKLTANLRAIANIERLFVVWNDSAVVPLDGKTLSMNINKLIKRHDIRDENNEIFHYTNHQCRKTVTVDLLSQGMSLKQVADLIGHSKETSARYYRAVQMKKIAELDNKMFEQLFEKMLDEEVKEQYTNEERKALIREVKLGARETPEGHGTCVKHVSFGPCHKKKCVGCKMLVTGPQKLPKWYQLYEEQQQFLKDMKEEFEKYGEKNYQGHRSYQAESHLLDVYRRTIEKIEKFAKERGISIEQYRQ